MCACAEKYFGITHLAEELNGIKNITNIQHINCKPNSSVFFGT